LEVRRQEGMKLNEKLKSEQKESICLLNDTHIDKDDKLKLEVRMDEIKDQYQKENDSFERIIGWQGVYKNPLDTLPLYSAKRKLKDQIFFDTWKPLLQDI
jgi:hypothetical protein